MSTPALILATSVAFLGAPVGVLAALGVIGVTGGVLLVRGAGAAGVARSCSRSASVRASRATRWSTTAASATPPRSRTSRPCSRSPRSRTRSPSPPSAAAPRCAR
jgi:hypothetical protein